MIGKRRGRPSYERLRQVLTADGSVKPGGVRAIARNFRRLIQEYQKRKKQLQKDERRDEFQKFVARTAEIHQSEWNTEEAAEVVVALTMKYVVWTSTGPFNLIGNIFVNGVMYQIHNNRFRSTIRKETLSGFKREFKSAFCVYCHSLTLYAGLATFRPPKTRINPDLPDILTTHELSKHFEACMQLRRSFRTKKVPEIIQAPDDDKQIIRAFDQVLTEEYVDPGFNAVEAASSDEEASSSDQEESDDERVQICDDFPYESDMDSIVDETEPDTEVSDSDSDEKQ